MKTDFLFVFSTSHILGSIKRRLTSEYFWEGPVRWYWAIWNYCLVIFMTFYVCWIISSFVKSDKSFFLKLFRPKKLNDPHWKQLHRRSLWWYFIVSLTSDMNRSGSRTSLWRSLSLERVGEPDLIFHHQPETWHTNALNPISPYFHHHHHSSSSPPPPPPSLNHERLSADSAQQKQHIRGNPSRGRNDQVIIMVMMVVMVIMMVIMVIMMIMMIITCYMLYYYWLYTVIYHFIYFLYGIYIRTRKLSVFEPRTANT